DSIDSLPVIPGAAEFLAMGSLDVDEIVQAGIDHSVGIQTRLTSGENIYSQDLVLSFDPGVLEPRASNFIEYSANTVGFGAEYKVVGNTIRIAAASGTSNTINGLLATLNFDVIADEAGQTEIVLESFGLNSNLESALVTITVDIRTSVADDSIIPDQFILEQNYPNPFNPTTTISYGLPEASEVSIIIYDVKGREVANLVQSSQSAGWYDIQWNGLSNSGNPASTGLYFTRIQAGGFSDVIKMVYLR
ncbi:MAG: cohesin domain-containing protein, partial [Candidatus Marinimicrobia bacterium]|nr:cohesin domain-containing protein [Candidatus Neomarinimicrobiota bacterium]